MRYTLLLAFFLHSLLSNAQDTLSMTFIGDIMQHGPQITSAYKSAAKKYQYDSCFKYIRHEMSSSDLTIANLEFTFGGEPYLGYPMFSAPDQMGEALQNAGVDVLVTANNHTCDRRKAGVIRTIDVLDTLQMAHTGSFRNQAEKDTLYPLLIEEKGFRLALLNYTYGTNGMPIEDPVRVNLIQEDSIKRDLEKAVKMGVDQIIVFIHWGSEYTHNPNQQQKDIAKLLFENGADIVIGAHPHVLQPMYYEQADSTKEGTVLAYSLGNFVSNQRTAPRDGGAMFKLTLIKEEEKVRIENVGYLLTWVWLPIIEGKRNYFILPASKYEENRQMVDTWSHNKMKTFIKSSRELLDAKNVGVKEYRFLANEWILEND